MSKAIPNDYMALLKEASEMFEETGCVTGIDGEQVPAESIVPDAKEYISETIDDPRSIYDPAIWDTHPAQHLTNEQQKACLDSAAADLIHEITHGASLN